MFIVGIQQIMSKVSAWSKRSISHKHGMVMNSEYRISERETVKMMCIWREDLQVAGNALFFIIKSFSEPFNS